MNEHVKWFKRYAECYLDWSHSNFDRIAKETGAKYLKEHLEERKYIRNKPMRDFAAMLAQTNKHFMAEIADSVMKSLDRIRLPN